MNKIDIKLVELMNTYPEFAELLDRTYYKFCDNHLDLIHGIFQTHGWVYGSTERGEHDGVPDKVDLMRCITGLLGSCLRSVYGKDKAYQEDGFRESTVASGRFRVQVRQYKDYPGHNFVRIEFLPLNEQHYQYWLNEEKGIDN